MRHHGGLSREPRVKEGDNNSWECCTRLDTALYRIAPRLWERCSRPKPIVQSPPQPARKERTCHFSSFSRENYNTPCFSQNTGAFQELTPSFQTSRHALMSDTTRGTHSAACSYDDVFVDKNGRPELETPSRQPPAESATLTYSARRRAVQASSSTGGSNVPFMHFPQDMASKEGRYTALADERSTDANDGSHVSSSTSDGQPRGVNTQERGHDTHTRASATNLDSRPRDVSDQDEETEVGADESEDDADSMRLERLVLRSRDDTASMTSSMEVRRHGIRVSCLIASYLGLCLHCRRCMDSGMATRCRVPRGYPLRE